MKSVFLLALMLAYAASALADNDKGLYAGAGVGQFFIKARNLSDIQQAVSGFDSDDTSFKVFAGWRFNRYIAAELEYIDFGKPEDDVNGVNVEAGIDGFAPSVVGTLPLGPLELFAKAGYLFYDLNVKADGQKIASVSGNAEDVLYGAGLGITLFQHINARLEYQRIEISDTVDDADSIWLTGSWRF